MSTVLFLVRHAAHGLLKHKLVGRMSQVSLSEEGRRQAQALGSRLAREELSLVQASPRDRAMETAQAIARAASVSLEQVDALDELDMGEWTGKSFDELSVDVRWQAWNGRRSSARPPEGESMLEAQARIIGHIQHLAAGRPNGRIALVSHGDVIRSALLYLLMMPIDAYDRIEIDPASISTVVVGNWGAKVLSLNERIAP